VADDTQDWSRLRRIAAHGGGPERTIRTDAVMGTAIRVEVVGDVREAVLDEVFAWFREVDARFSMWRRDSEMSRLARGEIDESDVHPDVRAVLAMCEDVRIMSGGAFDIRRHRPDGLLDPTALVKGWSVDRAGLMLAAGGIADWSINAGGDILVHGSSGEEATWPIGIQHPLVRDAVAAVVRGTDLALATSGAYERGDHVVDARGAISPATLLSATVVGPELALADAYATAAFAMGADAARWLAGLPDYEGCVITADQRLVWTAGFERYLERGDAAPASASA
jgi:thiamine biosynthesis lipoprotein